MAKRDYYETLGVGKSAPADEIKKAYRKLAKQYHPDLNPGNAEAEAKLKEVNEAYEVLSDDDKKSRYDQYGHAGVDPNYSQGGGFDGFSGGFSDLGDIFGSIFGGGSRQTQSRTGPRQGERIVVETQISFEEAAFGCEKDVDVSRIDPCDDCSGTGAQPGTEARRCDACRGTGVVTTNQRTPFGTMQSQSECPKCQGRGKIIEKPCDKCKGQGRVRRRKTISVNIPAGIDDDQTLSVRGAGSAGANGGARGDLYVTVRVKRHDVFERDGTTVLYTLPVSFTDAALGASLDVPTLDGDVRWTVPEGTQTGTRFRLRGKGITSLRTGSRGDQIITVTVVTPTRLTSEQRDLLRRLSDGGDAGASDKKNQKKK
ncbi:MAG: molecular chaperone DnaJ [Oscillospiraceae bacterium]|jgi:molecular chaperone DnaJ|nr:molecular chaperone DnaJ [Oscillospiraceae bacterium]